MKKLLLLVVVLMLAGCCLRNELYEEYECDATYTQPDYKVDLRK